MLLPVDSLDDRKFQQLVDEVKKRIPHYCPEWTDHNVSDPGITLLELFAWMIELLLYRVNQVPRLHYIKFMELFGVKLAGPEAAEAEITFWLSGPRPQDFAIDAGTEVSTIQTETKPSIIFATQEPFTVRTPRPEVILRCALDARGSEYYEQLNSLLPGAALQVPKAIFSPMPKPDDTLCFGFENDLSRHIVRLEFNVFELSGSGLNEDLTDQFLVWEVAGANGAWEPCQVDGAHTYRGFNRNGAVQLHLPFMHQWEINGHKCFWLRVRVTAAQRGSEEKGGYGSSPKLYRVEKISTLGRTVNARHAQVIKDEVLGISDGTPGQRFFVQTTPVLPRQPTEKWVRVSTPGTADQLWYEVENFTDKTENEPCYTLDSITGEVRFGPALRQRDGIIRHYGQTPARGATLTFVRYQSGGGVGGRVKSGELNTLKSSIPFISRVANRTDARGGVNAQEIEEAMLQMPKLLRTRQRAVTPDDFVFLVEQAFASEVARAHCLPPTLPGEGENQLAPPKIELRLVPRPAQITNQYRWSASELLPSAALCTRVKAFLDQKRLLGTRLEVSGPTLHWVVVEVNVRTAPGVDRERLRNLLLRRLYQFLNPLTGGFEEKGWPLGQPLQKWQLYQFLHHTNRNRAHMDDALLLDMILLLEIALFPAQSDGVKTGDACEELPVDVAGVIASAGHSVEFINL